MKLNEEIVHFFQGQDCVLVSTLDKRRFVHNSCKGIVRIEEKGWVYLLDLYQARTYINLGKNPGISVTAFNEHDFSGYCLKGKAKIVRKDKLSPEIISAWDDRITGRVTKRLLKNMREGKGHPAHPELLLPQPQYLIVMKVREVVDLTPPLLKG